MMSPAYLVALEGDAVDDSEYGVEEFCGEIGIDPEDAIYFNGDKLTNTDIAYLHNKYPELMGMIPIFTIISGIGKIASGAIGAGKKIAKAIRNARRRRHGGGSAPAVVAVPQAVAPVPAQGLLQNKAVPIAIGAGALLIVGVLLIKRKRK